MCTVTYLPLGDNDFILTSNRDEAVIRQKAIDPQVESYKQKKMIFPKDAAGGTWIGVTEKRRAVVLLNGAFEKHERILPYRHSRGLVVKEALAAEIVLDFLNGFNLENIEPFTMIVLEWTPRQLLLELRWDGKVRHLKTLAEAPAIWSSSTLYSLDMRWKRVQWFNDWLQENKDYSVKKIRRFHKEAGDGDPVSDLLTKRGYLETISVTSIEKRGDKVNLIYEDLVSDTTSSASFNLEKSLL